MTAKPGQGWQKVDSLAGSYSDPVVIAAPVTHNNDLPLSVRVRDVKSGSFELGMMSPCEATGDSNLDSGNCPPNGGWDSETVRYLVIEAGSWTFPDGTKIEAHSRSVTSLRANEDGLRDEGVKVDYDHVYQDRPVVLHQVMTGDGNSEWITTSAWSNEDGRGQPPGTDTAKIALEGAEAVTDADVGPETVGWVAIQPGSGTNDGHPYQAGYTGSRTIVRHPDGCTSLGSWSNFSSQPDAVATMTTVNDDDGGWTRYCGNAVETSGLNVHIAEDVTQNAERGGGQEQAAWFAFEAGQKGTLNPFEPSTPIMAASMNGVVDDDGGWLRSCGANSEPTKLEAETAEDQTQDSERAGSDEQGSYFAFEQDEVGTLNDPSSSNTADFETGRIQVSSTVDNQNDDKKVWRELQEGEELDGDYDNPVIIAGPVTHANDRAMSARVRKLNFNRANGSFEIGMQSPCEATGNSNVDSGDCPPTQWVDDKIPYLVMEAGTWEFPDGTRVEAHTTTISTLRANNDGMRSASEQATLSNAAAFASEPIVLHQVMSDDNYSWITTSAWRQGDRTVPPKPTQDSGNFRLALEGAQGVTSENGGETVGWIAIEPEQGTNSNGQYVAGQTDSAKLPRHDKDACGSAGGDFDFRIDHYAITDPGTGVTCEALPVEIVAHDENDNPVEPSDGLTIDVSATKPANDDPAPDTTWASSDSDETSHTFGGNSASVTLDLRRTSEGDVDVDVDGGTATEDSSEDPTITFKKAAFLFYADGSKSNLGTQIADKPSDEAPDDQNVELRAVEDPDVSNPDTACEPRLTDNQTIEMAFECTDPASCSSRQVEIDADPGGAFSGTAIAGNDSASVTTFSEVDLDFGSDGIAPFALRYRDAGEIKLHAKEELPESGDQPADTLEGASNAFVVRPFGFHVTAVGNPGATSASGDAYKDAGADFTVEATAVGWASGDDSNDDGVPDGYGNDDPTDNADLSTGGDNDRLPNFGPESDDEAVALTAKLFEPSGGSDPALGGTTTIGEAAFEDGTDVAKGAGSTTVHYDEVGIIELRAAIDDSSYQGVGNVKGRSPAVGRFIPDRFTLSDNDPVFGDEVSGVFTYMGQVFTYAAGSEPMITVTAVNDDGATTSNYGGEGTAEDYWKLDALTDSERSYADQAGAANANFNADKGPGTATWDDAGGNDTRADYDGQASLRVLDDELRYDRVDAANKQAPFDALIELTLAQAGLTDSDSVCFEPSGTCASFTVDGDGDDGTRDPVGSAGNSTELRYGRLVLDNASGAEIAPLDMPVRVEYWNANDTWHTNTDDSATELTLANEIDLTNEVGDIGTIATVDGDQDIALADAPNGGTTNLDANTPSPVTFTNGELVLTFAAPGQDNKGWAAAIPRLAGNHPYLQYAWGTDGDPADDTLDDDPRARATFGIYQGNRNWIHIRRVR